MRLSLGKHGSDVGKIHQLLLERGLDIPQDELNQQMFGAVTDSLIREFQEQNVDEFGRPLAVDGVVGPLTIWALRRDGWPSSFVAPDWHCDVNLLRGSVQKVVSAAVMDIGLREQPDGSNDGPMIRKFFPRGIEDVPWCAYAVSTWLEAADGGSPLPYRFGSVLSIVGWAQKRNLIVTDPRPGDLWCALRGSSRRGHVELIVHVFENGKLSTVGGNVRNAVRGVTRQPNSWTHLARLIHG